MKQIVDFIIVEKKGNNDTQVHVVRDTTCRIYSLTGSSADRINEIIGDMTLSSTHIYSDSIALFYWWEIS
jgi:hypothetical protein